MVILLGLLQLPLTKAMYANVARLNGGRFLPNFLQLVILKPLRGKINFRFSIQLEDKLEEKLNLLCGLPPQYKGHQEGRMHLVCGLLA